MEVKINVKIDIANFNQIIESLSQLIDRTKGNNILTPKENVIEESIYNLESEVNSDTDTNIDVEKLRAKIGQLSMSGKIVEVQKLLEKYKVQKLSDVKPEHYESLYKDITKQLN